MQPRRQQDSIDPHQHAFLPIGFTIDTFTGDKARLFASFV